MVGYNPQKAAEVMKNQVSPALWNRVPQSETNQPRALWKSLETLCQPFRLLDLPDEARNRIYQSLIDEEEDLCGLPLVCRQLRNETLPFSIQEGTFRLAFSHATMQEPEAFARRVRRWAAETFQAQHLKHLRSVRVGFSGPRKRSILRDGLGVRFSPESGLSAWFSSSVSGGKRSAREVKQALRTMIKPQIANIEADRKMLNLQGEAILLLLTSKSSMWVEVWREWQRLMKE